MIIELQRRLVEVGRIRMGEKKETSNGGSRPAKLTKWRLTSKDELRLQAAAKIYGGTVRAWDDQHELYTDADALDIAIVPGQALSQFYEHWGRPAAKKPIVCLRRCDGVTELLSDKPCLCVADGTPDKDRLCNPTTRLLVLLRSVPGIGAWRLDTHGWYAAQELAGTAEMLEMLTASRVPVRARLRLEQRSVQRGEELRRFVVPVIDIDATLDEAMAVLSDGVRAAARLELDPGAREIAGDGSGTTLRPIESGDTSVRDAPGFTPVSAPPGPAAPSIAEQLETAHKAPPRAPRANAATPIPPTRLPHKGAPDLPLEDGEPAEPATPHARPAGNPPTDATNQPSAPAEDDAAADPESAPTGSIRPDPVGKAPGSAVPVVTPDEAATIARNCREAGVPRAAFLAAWSAEQCDHVITSARAVPADMQPPLRARLLDCFHGRTIVIIDADTNAARLVDTDTGQAGENVPMPADAYWKARLEYVKGVGPAKLLRMARKIAVTRGFEQPSTIAEIPDDGHLRRELNVWLFEQCDVDAA